MVKARAMCACGWSWAGEDREDYAALLEDVARGAITGHRTTCVCGGDPQGRCPKHHWRGHHVVLVVTREIDFAAVQADDC